MTPRFEFIVCAALLAAVLACIGVWGVMTLWLTRVAWSLELLAVTAVPAGLAAALAALWTGQWPLVLGQASRLWRSVALALGTVAIALVVFVVLVLLGGIVAGMGELPLGSIGRLLGAALDRAMLLGLFAAALGALPGALLMVPVSLRYLQRRTAAVPA
ncbi:hypothetical protein [Luteimonas terrae]|uniref:Uncharacterized protein n=1 Tax=Luteimonas terrae TaxID=1530191 RepID=A0ABU1XRR1_9GAMM|nr:hypothetical protein [Luteimonas terrae]MDR7191433.1 hypothetical protein [Luteimonas terrae]